MGYGLDVPRTHGLLTPYGSVEMAGGGGRTLALVVPLIPWYIDMDKLACYHGKGEWDTEQGQPGLTV